MEYTKANNEIICVILSTTSTDKIHVALRKKSENSNDTYKECNLRKNDMIDRYQVKNYTKDKIDNIAKKRIRSIKQINNKNSSQKRIIQIKIGDPVQNNCGTLDHMNITIRTVQHTDITSTTKKLKNIIYNCKIPVMKKDPKKIIRIDRYLPCEYQYSIYTCTGATSKSDSNQSQLHVPNRHSPNTVVNEMFQV